MIPITLVSEDNQLYYVGTFSVGSPQAKLKLAIDLWDNDITIFKRIDITSATYSTDRSSTFSDVFSISGDRYRFPVIIDPYRTRRPHVCASCDGVFGIGYGSVLWKLWREMSFSPSRIYLGKINPIFKRETCGTIAVECSEFGDDRHSLCSTNSTSVYVKGVEVGSSYNVTFTLDHYTYLPNDLYGLYFRNKNVYTTFRWDPLVIKLHGISPFPSVLMTKDATCATDLTIAYGAEDFIDINSNWFDRKLTVKAHDRDNDIILGVNTFKKVIAHRTLFRGGNIMAIKKHDMIEHPSIGSLILVSILYFLLVRWKTSDLECVKDEIVKRRLLFTDTAYQALAIILSWLCMFALPFVRDALEQCDPLLYGSMIYVMVLLTVGSVVCLMLNIAKLVKRDYSTTVLNTTVTLEFTLFKRIMVETLVSNGILLTTIEGRTEGISGIPTLIISAFILYNLFFCTTISYYLLILYAKKVGSKFKLFTLSVLPGLLAYYLIITYVYVAQPMAERKLSITVPDIELILIMTGYVGLYVFTLFMIKLYIGRTVVKCILEEYDKQK